MICNDVAIFVKNNLLACYFMIIFFIIELSFSAMIPVFIRCGFGKASLNCVFWRLRKVKQNVINVEV